MYRKKFRSFQSSTVSLCRSKNCKVTVRQILRMILIGIQSYLSLGALQLAGLHTHEVESFQAKKVTVKKDQFWWYWSENNPSIARNNFYKWFRGLLFLVTPLDTDSCKSYFEYLMQNRIIVGILNYLVKTKHYFLLCIKVTQSKQCPRVYGNGLLRETKAKRYKKKSELSSVL